MNCPHCHFKHSISLNRTTDLGYQMYRCFECKRYFNSLPGTPFNFLPVPTDIVFQVLLCRLRYKLSLRDVAEMFLLRGFEFTHETVREWEERFAPILAQQLRAKRKGKVGSSWYVDETYIKVKGKWCYLYRAIDRDVQKDWINWTAPFRSTVVSHTLIVVYGGCPIYSVSALDGNLVDSMLSQKRDMVAAQTFFRQAQEVAAQIPERVTTDGHDSYPRAITEVLGADVEHRVSGCLTNRIEQDHRGIKQRYYPMLGFKTFDSAQRYCQAFDEMRNFFRPRSRMGEPLRVVARMFHPGEYRSGCLYPQGESNLWHGCKNYKMFSKLPNHK